MLQDSDTIRISDVSEAVVHGILEVISDGIWDWHANTGFVYRNPGWVTVHPDGIDRKK